MSLNRRRFLLAPFFVPRLASAAQRWLDRKPAEWTPDDIQTVLNRSAWVREAPLGMDPAEGGRRKQNQGGSRLTEFNILVRWESGLPVRLARRIATLPDSGVDRYEISVSRLPLPFLTAVLGQKAEPAATRREIAAELAKSTLIERPGKGSIRAATAEWVESDFSPRVSIGFSANERPIDVSEWEVAVVGRIGGLRFRANFPLKPMVYRGKLEL
jgi:hypothetical protein